MARIKFTSACVFFLLLIISNEVLLSEGRHFKQKKKGKECRKCLMHDKKGDGHELSGGMQHYHSSTVMDVDNFRPTAPGHSPGIGHSLVENYHASAGIDVDNFRPTAPGHSPGIGHSLVENYHASADIDVDKFRPTAPGHSPGIGLSQVEHYHTSTDIDVDNFRPTTPGHSPGIGHSLRN